MSAPAVSGPEVRAAPTVVGRYVLHAAIARGGMATIHLARLLGADGFSRMVAAKRLHPQFTEDAELVEMLLDEARIASKIHHPNVVPVLDVVRSGGEVILVQEYVHGVPLDKLLRAATQAHELLPAPVVIAIAADMIAGLAAAHEAKDEMGASLGIVHRDVSPQNVIAGADGIARLLDFGVAKASLNAHVTRAGMFKGKIAYTAPEQLRGEVTPAIDIYAAAVVTWEALAGRRLHPGLREMEMVAAVSNGDLQKLCDAVDEESVSPARWAILKRVEPVLARAMSLAPEDRFASATELRETLLAAAPAATAAEVSQWVKRLGKEYLEGREKIIVAEESTWRQRASATPADAEPASESTDTAGSLRASAVPIEHAPKRGQWAIVAALAMIGALLTAIMLMLMRRPPDPIAGPTISAAANVPPVVAPPAITPEVAPAPLPTITASARTDPPPLRAPSVPRAAAVRAPAPAPPAPQASPRADCNPPFYFDGKKKVFKPGCL